MNILKIGLGLMTAVVMVSGLVLAAVKFARKDEGAMWYLIWTVGASAALGLVLNLVHAILELVRQGLFPVRQLLVALLPGPRARLRPVLVYPPPILDLECQLVHLRRWWR